MIVRAVQATQLFDILLILLKKTKGSLLASLAQTAGRIAVAYIFMTPETDQKIFALTVIAWSVADVNRYLYYLFPRNSATILLRYNSFIVLYPIGIYG